MIINTNIMILEQDLRINGQLFKEVQNFIQSGASINYKNLISDEIQSRIAAGNRCFYSIRQIFRSTAMSNEVKIEIYKMMVRSVVVFGGETWAMNERDMKRLGTWERKILRIHGPEIKQGTWKIGANQEWRKLYISRHSSRYKKEKTGMDWTCSKDESVKES
jgi:hypothetical protein